MCDRFILVRLFLIVRIILISQFRFVLLLKELNMKNFFVIWISVLLIVSIAVSCTKVNNNVERELNTKLDSISYIIGLEFAANLPNDGFDTVNPWLVAIGMDDYYNNRDFLVPGEQAQEFLKEFALKEKVEKYLVQYGDIKLEGEKFLEENRINEGVVTLPSGLQYRVLKEGSGPKPKSNDLVRVYYKGWLLSGEVFDEHLEGDPIPFKVDRIIPGWTEALQLMNEGAKWQLFVPFDLGYGTEIRPGSIIVPYSMLSFEIELIKVGSE